MMEENDVGDVILKYELHKRGDISIYNGNLFTPRSGLNAAAKYMVSVASNNCHYIF